MQRTNPCLVNCQKTTIRPLTSATLLHNETRCIIKNSNISSGIRYTIEHLTHLEMLAHIFRKGTKSDTRKVIDSEPCVPGLSNGNMPVHNALISASAKRSLSVGRPMLTVSSCIISFQHSFLLKERVEFLAKVKKNAPQFAQ